MKKEDKKSKLDVTLAEIEKRFGKNTIINVDKNYKTNVDSIPTGSLSLDMALGIGGLPKGRMIEIFGPEASGKSTLALSLVKQVQKLKGKSAYIDMENGLDYEYAKTMGIKLEDVIITQPECAEDALDILQSLVESEEVDLIILDSVASLVTKPEIEGEMGQSHIGLLARLMSQAMRKLAGIINRTQTCVVFINQIRQKINTFGFGNPNTTPGGLALKFYSSVRLDLRRIKTLKKGDDCIGTRIKAKVVKNKVAPPFRTAEFEIYFDSGLSKDSDILSLAITHGIIKKSGAWFSYDGTQIGQGFEGARLYLKEHLTICQKIEKQIYNLLGKGGENG